MSDSGSDSDSGPPQPDAADFPSVLPSPEETAQVYTNSAESLAREYDALESNTEISSSDFETSAKEILAQLQNYAQQTPFPFDTAANEAYQAKINRIREKVSDDFTQSARSSSPLFVAGGKAPSRPQSEYLATLPGSLPAGSSATPSYSVSTSSAAPTTTSGGAKADPPFIPPVLDPPIPGNPVVVGIALTHTTLCNQPVFETRLDDEVFRGGFSLPIAAKVAKAGKKFKKTPLLFLGVSMAPYKKPTAETNAQKRRQARQRRSHAHNANTPVTVAGTATISLGHFTRDDRNLKPKPGDWVAFSAEPHFFSSYHAEIERFKSMDDQDDAGDAVKSADIPMGVRVEKYDPTVDGHLPFGICVSVANSPRSEITVLLRKDAYYNKLAV